MTKFSLLKPARCALSLALLAIGVQSPSQTLPAPEQQQERKKERRWHMMRPVVRGTRAAVAAGTPLVTEAATRVLHAGGNGVDAGVAALFAAAVSEFSHFGFGGEAPILIRTSEGTVHCIPGLGPAPALMTRKFFQKLRTLPEDEQEARRRGRKTGPIPAYGLLPALTPGMVDAGLLALKKFGTKPFAEVIQPALDLADAMPLDEIRARAITRASRFLQRYPTSRRVFLPTGRLPRPGEIFHQPDLAKTIRLMVQAERKALESGAGRGEAIEAVRDLFYRGEIARKIAGFSKKNKGLLRYEDLASFRLEVEKPLKTTYRGFEVYKGGFWTQGAVMIQTLNILEGFDLRSMGWNSAIYIHILVEALKLAYADRDTYYADPKFASIPSALLSKTYAAERRQMIDPERASAAFRPGRFGKGQPPHPSRFKGQLRPLGDSLASHDTTGINIIASDGTMFSTTPSGAWMPSVIAADTGIPLTQRAQSFVMIPDHPNVVEPGKRPRITLTPTIVTRGGDPFLALSTPGGDMQEQALLQVMLLTMQFGVNPQWAVEAPRFQTRHLVSSFDDHAINRNLLLLDERVPEEVMRQLQSWGHKVERRSRWQSGSAPVAVHLRPSGVIEAGADPYGYRYAAAW